MTPEEFTDKIRNSPSIPTGPDYHIARAKNALRQLEFASRPLIHGTTNTEDLRISAGHAMHYTGEALEHLIRALELMRGES